ncbi:MAG: transposase, partial [Snodgrassella sp.]
LISIYAGAFPNVLIVSESSAINGIINVFIGCIERFNRTYRAEVLDLYLFNNLEQARKVTEEWLTIYNTERPHEALNNMTPIEYKTLKQVA